MKNNVHKQVIGVCWIIFGALIFSLLVLKFDSVSKLIAIAGMLVSLVYLAAGFTLMANLRKSSWICLPCSVLSLLNFPLGTLLGIYYLWYYFRIEQAN